MPESEDRPEGRPERRPGPRPDGKAAARARIAQQQSWVDQQIRIATERGDFDNLPGAGKPIPDLGAAHDPDWWLKKLVERERVAVLPPSLALRKEDAELDGSLDALNTEAEVRQHLQDFNDRVVAARYQLPEGPPLVTMPRDVDEAVTAWGERRAARLAARRAELRARAAAEAGAPVPKRSRWWRK